MRDVAVSGFQRLALPISPGVTPPAAERLMQACWPGPLTLVFRAAEAGPSVLTAGTGTIGVRLSAYPAVPRGLEMMGGPLTRTSANRTGQAPPATAGGVAPRFAGRVSSI